MESSVFRDHLHLMLLSLLETGPRSGLEIIHGLQDTTGGFFELGMGHLYPVLHQLEQEQKIRGEFQASSRSGTLVKCYALTHLGVAELETRREDLDQMVRILPFLLR